MEKRRQYSDQTTASMHRCQNSVKTNVLPLLQHVKTGSGASYSMGTGVLSRGLSDRSLKLTIHLHLVPELKNERSYNSIPAIRLHGADRNKFRSPSISPDKKNKQDRQITYNVTMRRVRVSIVAVEMQSLLHILSVCM